MRSTIRNYGLYVEYYKPEQLQVVRIMQIITSVQPIILVMTF